LLSLVNRPGHEFHCMVGPDSAHDEESCSRGEECSGAVLSDAGEQETCPNEGTDGGHEEDGGPSKRGAALGAIHPFRTDGL
jgi:hypothetical protein